MYERRKSVRGGDAFLEKFRECQNHNPSPSEKRYLTVAELALQGKRVKKNKPEGKNKPKRKT